MQCAVCPSLNNGAGAWSKMWTNALIVPHRTPAIQFIRVYTDVTKRGLGAAKCLSVARGLLFKNDAMLDIATCFINT